MPAGNTVLGKVTRRLIPFLFVVYIFNILDRTNVSIAALTMKPDLRFSDAVYGLGAGIFFLGYCLFEVPSNLILQRVGARVWIARIMLTWGLISSGMMFVKSPASFYLLRLLLGVAEAGFFPGILLYLTYWFPAAERAKAVSRFMTGVPLAAVLGGPLSAALLKLNGVAGLKGWQWIFLAEGLPSVLLGIVTLCYLTDRPQQAHWLLPEEREWLTERLQREQADREQHDSLTLWQTLAHPRMLPLCASPLLAFICGYGVSLWSPLLLQSRSAWSAPVVSMVGAIPGLCAALGMVLVGAHSDRRRERRRHVACAYGVGALGVAVSAWAHSPVLTVAGLALASLGLMSSLGPFWALVTGSMSGRAAPGAIAFTTSVASMGGFIGPTVMGLLKGATGSFEVGLSVLAVCQLAAGLLVLLVRPEPVLECDTRTTLGPSGTASTARTS